LHFHSAYRISSHSFMSFLGSPHTVLKYLFATARMQSSIQVARKVRWNDVNALSVFGCPANSVGDELALRMLRQLLEGTSVSLNIAPGKMLSSEVVAAVRQCGCRVICIIDLPPSAPSKTRYLVKKIRASIPEIKIVVGRCTPPTLPDANPELIIDSGANKVASSLLEVREQLRQFALLTPPEPEKDSVADSPRTGV